MKFLITPRKNLSFEPITSKENDALKEEINRLGEFVEGADIDIYVVGGIAVALTNGGFRRNHRDIDLAIFNTDLDSFYQYAVSKGYYFVKKNGHTHISSRHDLNILSRTTPEEIMDEGYCRVLLRKLAIVQGVKKKMDCFDLFLYEDRGESIYLIDPKISIPRDEFFPARRYPLENGTEVMIPNLKYRPRMWSANARAGDEVYLAAGAAKGNI